MRHRNEWHAPSEVQLELASKLGIKVPSGISREELSMLIDRHKRDQIQSLIKELDMRAGRYFRRKQDGAIYEIRGVRLDRRELNVFNETIGRGTTVGLSRFTEFYEMVE